MTDDQPQEAPLNPYAAPADVEHVDEVKQPETEHERVRKAHLSHEASVKSVSLLFYLGAFLVFLMIFGLGMDIVIRIQAWSPVQLTINVLIIVGIAALAAGLIAIGLGLNRLKSWARWTALGLYSLILLVQLVSAVLVAASAGGAVISVLCAALIPGYVVVVMLHSKSRMVFSPYYKEVIATTPHIKYKTSILVWVFFVLLIVFIAIGIAASFFRI